MLKNHNAFVVAIEGTDGAGKETQTALVVANLRKRGYKVGTMSFPVYTSITGQTIKKMLVEGKACVYERANMYAADRLAHKYELAELIRCNDFVILDRYIGSMVAYGCAMIDSEYNGNICNVTPSLPVNVNSFVDYVQNLELNVNVMPVVNLNLALTVKPEITRQLMANRGELDANEKSTLLQEAVYQFYYSMQDREKSNHFMLRYAEYFDQLDCVGDNGKMVDKNILANEITERVMCFFES